MNENPWLLTCGVCCLWPMAWAVITAVVTRWIVLGGGIRNPFYVKREDSIGYGSSPVRAQRRQ